jgi:hypothetical protein
MTPRNEEQYQQNMERVEEANDEGDLPGAEQQ